MFAANPLAANPDGACYASVVLEASATDTLICAEESWIKWQVFADLWANGHSRQIRIKLHQQSVQWHLGIHPKNTKRISKPSMDNHAEFTSKLSIGR
ncbi:MAG: hypothetical protein R2774_00145 [Saprospiraceae bacterium]